MILMVMNLHMFYLRYIRYRMNLILISLVQK